MQWSDPRLIQYVTSRLAAKQAVVNAMKNCGEQLSRPLIGEMRIVKTIVGKPMLAVEGRMERLFYRVGIAHTHISISHDAGTTIAWTLLEVQSPAPYPVKPFPDCGFTVTPEPNGVDSSGMSHQSLPALPNRIFGIGVDLVEIERIARVLANLPDRFIKKCCHSDEIQEMRRLCEQRRTKFVADRWAVKEAVIKAYGRALSFPEIRVVAGTGEDARLVFEGKTKEFFDEAGIVFSAVRIVRTEERVTAYVILWTSHEQLKEIRLSKEFVERQRARTVDLII